MPQRRLILAAYDSPDTRRRARLLDRVRGFGIDPQYSFHECLLTGAERRELWRALRRGVDTEADKLVMILVGDNAWIWRLGDEPGLRPRQKPGLIWVG
jgi:CRISPR-associated protein Cas2